MAAAKRWAAELTRDRPEIVRIGAFGSYVRGDYVPGSDLDAIIELATSDKDRWIDRVADYRPNHLPVPVDVFPYTTSELEDLRARRVAFLKTIFDEVVWLA